MALVSGGLVAWVSLKKWRRKVKKERPPIEEMLLRPPGYSLQERLEDYRMNCMEYLIRAMLFGALLTALIAYIGFSWVESGMSGWLKANGGFAALFLPKLLPYTLSFSLAVAALSFAVVKDFARLVSTLEKCRSHYLGLRGEQAVAETLGGLSRLGWQVFHDLPGGKNWNIDHVAVGPGGVFALETKTRSKRASPPGTKDYEVHFDGVSLKFPWGEAKGAVKQVSSNAKWLAGLLSQATGDEVEVAPIIVIPGWYVVSRGNYAVKAMAPSYMAKYLAGLPQRLSDSQVRRIAHQVAQKCRDVEF
jgi:hypothetical protein